MTTLSAIFYRVTDFYFGFSVGVFFGGIVAGLWVGAPRGHAPEEDERWKN